MAGIVAVAVPIAVGSARGALAEASPSVAAGEPLAPGWSRLRQAPPTPGSYELPPLGAAGDGRVLDADGRSWRLHDLLGDRVVVLSFVYTSCADVNGCPLATHVLAGLRRGIAADPSLRDHVRLLTMSFDPENDTPEVMRRHREHLVTPEVDWRFLTTDSVETLAPILDAYGQSVRREHDESGRPLGTISHVLRVFLIDPERRIRNVYSASFLHTDLLERDIRTLLLESDDRSAPVAVERSGRPVDLLRLHREPPLGLPPLPPGTPPVTAEQIALGRKLFFDRRLSHNDTISCAMCHVPEQGFTSNEMATAVGIEGRTVRRNAPTLYNVAYVKQLFHDGRETRLEQQVWAPILAANEMGNPSIGYVLDEIRSLPDYAGLFERAFDGRGPTMETVGAALASYERTLQSANSPFDRWRFGGEAGALSPAAERGFALFTGKAGCSGCHTIGTAHALFTDEQLHNTGVGYRTIERARASRRVEIAPGTFVSVAPGAVAETERPPSDLGRYEVTLDPADRWKYRTPSLRNVALSAPYMHDGSIATLAGVVELYDAGGIANENLDRRLEPLGLTPAEKKDLVAFLESLTGDVGAIVSDARAAQIGDPH